MPRIAPIAPDRRLGLSDTEIELARQGTARPQGSPRWSPWASGSFALARIPFAVLVALSGPVGTRAQQRRALTTSSRARARCLTGAYLTSEQRHNQGAQRDQPDEGKRQFSPGMEPGRESAVDDEAARAVLGYARG